MAARTVPNNSPNGLRAVSTNLYDRHGSSGGVPTAAVGASSDNGLAEADGPAGFLVGEDPLLGEALGSPPEPDDLADGPGLELDFGDIGPEPRPGSAAGDPAGDDLIAEPSFQPAGFGVGEPEPAPRVVLGTGPAPSPVTISFRDPGEDAGDSELGLELGPAGGRDSLDLADVQDRADIPASPEAPDRAGHGPILDVELSGMFEPDTMEVAISTPRRASSAPGQIPAPRPSRSPSPSAEPGDGFVHALKPGTSYQSVADDISGSVDAGAAADESKDKRVERRVGGLIDRACREADEGGRIQSVIALGLALDEAPDSALAQKIIHANRDRLLAVYRGYLGTLDVRPSVAVSLSALKSHELDSRAVFLLSRIDGTLTFEDILDISGMPRLETFRHLAWLLLHEILVVRGG